jgi:hypothetical protein
MNYFRVLVRSIERSFTSAFVPAFFVLLLGAAGLRTFGPHGSGIGSSSKMLELASWTGPLLWTSVAIGFGVMACIQLFKPEIRSAFHSAAIARWLQFSPSEFRSERMIYELGMGRSGRAALELPIEQLVAQIQAAADLELSSNYPYPIRERTRVVRIILRRFEDFPEFPEVPKELGARISFLIQRRLDELQIQVRYSWRRLLRFLALSLSLIFTSALAAAFDLWRSNFLGTSFVVLLLALLGAFFASAARDLIAALERLRA